jgi:GTP-binding protein Era
VYAEDSRGWKSQPIGSVAVLSSAAATRFLSLSIANPPHHDEQRAVPEFPGVPMSSETPFRAGMVAVVGRPNVGKSTLINALVGYKVSIVSDRPQTTRHRILGIHTEDAGQIVFVDTPGLHSDQKRAINRYMNRAARGALADVQLAAMVIEAGQWREEDEAAFKVLAEEPDLPRVLIINKVDKIADKGELLPFIAKVGEGRGFAEIFPISARRNSGLADLRTCLIKLLPESEPLYGEDEVTDRSERFLAAELVREQLMRQLGAEVPYATTVTIDKFAEDGKLLCMWSVIARRPSSSAPAASACAASDRAPGSRWKSSSAARSSCSCGARCARPGRMTRRRCAGSATSDGIRAGGPSAVEQRQARVY